MGITASQLRADVYRLLDDVLETGIPLEIDRKGQRLLVVPAERHDKLDNLIRRPEVLSGDPDDLVSIDWSDTWQP